jgi:hypothetical protein
MFSQDTITNAFYDCDLLFDLCSTVGSDRQCGHAKQEDTTLIAVSQEV